VQPELGFEGGNRLGRGRITKNHLRHIAGQQLQHREDQRGGGGQRGQQGQQSFEKKQTHAGGREAESGVLPMMQESAASGPVDRPKSAAQRSCWFS
jgi:hypothetical protein